MPIVQVCFHLLFLSTSNSISIHLTVLDLKERALEVMLQQAKTCIEINNYSKSLSILHEAEILIKVGQSEVINERRRL